MAGEKAIELARSVMQNPEYIRNICTSAHIHHGKCVRGDSRLLLADGSVKTAKELYDLATTIGDKFEEKEEHTIYDLTKKDITVFSLNKETGQLEKKKVGMAWKLTGGKLIQIRLRNGFEIATTPEHKYITLENATFTEKPAADLKLGDTIVCSRTTAVTSTFDVKKEILERLRTYNFYVYLKKEFSAILKEKIFQYGLAKKINTPLKEKSFYHGLWQDRLCLNDLLQICSLLQVTDVYDSIDSIVYRGGKQRGHNSIPIRLPQNFNDFYYLAGLFLGDGTFKRFIVGKEELRALFIRICTSLDFHPVRKDDPGKTPALETNKTLLYILHALFDYPLQQKSHHIKISDLVWKSPKEYTACLLRGYFDTDGTVERTRGAISITSVSKQMIKDLQLLLLRFGIVPIIQGDTLYISGFSVRNYLDHIGFFVQQKQTRAQALAQSAIGSYVTDWITTQEHTRVSSANTEQLLQLGFQEQTLHKYFNESITYLTITSISEEYADTVYDFTIPDYHNFIAEGMVIHNTALTDNLIAGAGLMSAKAAGSLEEGMVTWGHADEQERLLTVDAANVSMVHNFNGKDFVINLIDTPGHVDFGGDVTRAMRAVDGTLVLVCGVEGIMPQTETVVRQAVRERVKPILFINKVDRMIMELKLTPEKMQERFLNIISEFNQFLENVAEPEYRQKWKVSVTEGSVAFGSARENWALSLPYMQKKGVTFKDIITIYETKEGEERDAALLEKANLYEVILDMVIKHLPAPHAAQKYRIPKIWHGEPESEFGKSLLTCDPKGKLGFVITKITIDPVTGGEISAGRLFSGTVSKGMEVYLNNAKQKTRIQNVYFYQSVKRVQVDSIPCGNIIAIGGVSASAGETITELPETAFEEMVHIFEPVITKAIEPKKSGDLPKLVEVLRKVAKEDPSIRVQIDEETGENLISGMGELHLEIIENRIVTEKGLEVKTSNPIVVYRETIARLSPETEGKSPNKHNKFYFTVEPLPEEVYKLIKAGDIPETRFKKKNDDVIQKLVGLGWETKEANKIRAVFRGNMFLDNTRGVVHIGEVIDLVLDGFDQVMEGGPLAREPCVKLLIKLHDTKLHEDSIHRGPAQILPAVREGLRDAMRNANPIIYEPVQIIQFEAPITFMSDLSKLVANKRGQLLNMTQEGGTVILEAKMPVAEMIGLSSTLRSATEGRGIFFVVDQTFEKLPSELQIKVIQQIRQRKGLTENQ